MSILNEEKKSRSLLAQNILRAKAKKIFSKDKALSCLLKSEPFLKEISRLFSELYHCDISYDKFVRVATDCGVIDRERLVLTAELFRAYVETMKSNDFDVPTSMMKEKKFFASKNEEIKTRLEFLLNLFEGKKRLDFISKEAKCVKYLEFSDIQNEAAFVVEEVKRLIDTGSCSFDEIAVFVDKTAARQKFLDLMRAENLPVVSSIYNEDYENLKRKLTVYQKISAIFSELGLETFSYKDFKELIPISKAEYEIFIEELDEIFMGLWMEILEGDYSIQKGKAFPIVDYDKFSEQDKVILNKEFSAIKAFYADYRTSNFAGAIGTVLRRYFELFAQTEIKDIAAGKIKSLNELQDLYDNVLCEKPDFASFFEIMEWLPADSNKEKTSIRLASITANIKDDFKYIFVCGLTENNFPGVNPSYPFVSADADGKITANLKALNPKFGHFLKTDEVHFAERFYSLLGVMAKAEKQITFISHTYEAKKQAQPSVFFKALKDNDSANFKYVEDKKVEMSVEVSEQSAVTETKKEKIIKDGDVLRLSPSAISAFLNCPRKYFYKNLLNLKEPSTFSASYGNIVHAVFEVLNRKYLSKYSKEVVLELAEILFNSKSDEAKTLAAGFGEIAMELVKATDELSLTEMKANFIEAVEDLSYSGFFDETPEAAVCEKSFSFTLPEIEGVVFDGRIDAILTRGYVARVVDYKTGRNKPKPLNETISAEGLQFKTQTAQKSFDYQIPLYYLASQNSSDLEAYKEKVTELGLLYVRPKSKDGGCDEDFVSAEKIEFHKDKILQNLKETVIDKIKEETEFKQSVGWNCENCAYKFLCDGGENE